MQYLVNNLCHEFTWDNLFKPYDIYLPISLVISMKLANEFVYYLNLLTADAIN